ncbi:MAG: hypothetical protein EA370_04240 [Wenzhouxiangella sp.]|nr:MAG: hypothetical protein EA370_04240 [Wenzhouxiangella sp.]
MHHAAIRLFSITTLFGVLTLALTACGGSADPDEDRTSTTELEQAWQEDPNAPMVSLFSDQLHNINIPQPGQAWIRVYGSNHTVPLMADCSTPAEPPPADQERAQHRFQVNLSWTLDDGSRIDLGLLRAIALDEALLWRQQGHETESVSLRLRSAGARPETKDRRHYNMRRNRPGSQPMISRSHDQAPQPAGQGDEIPGIRVHPDGHKATFVGRLGLSAPIEDSAFGEFEEIRIAIHCSQALPEIQ